jgi:anion-transporting  ArsA/GET3 family ATPase
LTPFDRQLLVVTGKGGTGKTTVAAALGLAAARNGRRTLVVEVGNQARIPELVGGSAAPPGDEAQVGDHLWATTIEPYRVMEEWIARILQSKSLTRVLTRTNFFRAFAEAAPGGRELGAIVKVWELAQQQRWDKRAQHYDLVVVDAPATGHALGMLRTPTTFHDIARVGPIASQSERVRKFLADPAKTAYVAVALPTELAVSETLGLGPRLEKAIGRQLEAIVVNAMLPERFSPEDLDAVRDAAARRNGTLAMAVEEVRGAELRADVQREYVERLRAEASAPVHELPYVFSPRLDLTDVEDLSERLEW